MSKRPEELTGFAALIVHAVSLCDVAGKPRILRNLYVEERLKEGLGTDKHGTGPDAVRSWCIGRTIPDAEEFFFLKRAINRRLVEIGKAPYFEDEPFPRVAPWGDGDGADPLDEESPSGTGYSQQTPFDVGFRELAATG